MEDKFYLPIGFKYKGEEITELIKADTGGEAEKIYTKKPSQTNLHTWFAQVIAASVESIGGDSIAEAYLKQGDKKNIPDAVLDIPLIDGGTLLMQIQRECWEDKIKDQRFRCTNCGEDLVAEINLNLITIPKNVGGIAIEEYAIPLDRTYDLIADEEQRLSAFDGFKFNHLLLRTATLRDAIKYESISKDEVLFWRKLAFDTLKGLYYQEPNEEGQPENPKIFVPEGYLSRRGMLFFNKDLDSKTLKSLRKGMQSILPSAKFYYEEDCPTCSKPTPFFASVGNFFTV